MRQLLPEPAREVDIAESYLADRREPLRGRPWLVVNMATTVDGATALDGRSGGIGGPSDRLAFHALRSAADVILVGAGTARAENYGPVRVPPAHLDARHRAGRHTAAQLAVVSASCSLDPGARLFSGTELPVLIYTSVDAPADRLEALREVAEVIVTGSRDVDLDAVMADLAARSARCVVCEGGPRLNSHLLDRDLVDEWCWTVGPLLASGISSRSVHAEGSAPLHSLVLDRLLTDGRDLLFRYLTVR